MVSASSDGRRRFIAYTPVVLWAASILILGSGPGSSAQTSRFIRPLIEFLFPGAAPDTFLLVHSFIRKAAHFVEYGILAILAARAFSGFTTGITKRHWPGFSLLTVLTVAMIDETNQSFNAARTGSGWDAALDLSGGIAGLLIFFFFTRYRRRKAARNIQTSAVV